MGVINGSLSMVTTSRHLTVPSSLVEAIEQYIRHEIPLVELRGILSDAIQKQPAYASTIHAVLDDKLENRRLTIVDYGELIVGMGEILSEDIPTDCSDAKPDTSGVYRIINPETMILEETNLQEVQSSSRESADAEVVEEVEPSAVTGADDAALNSPREGLVLRERAKSGRRALAHARGRVGHAVDNRRQKRGDENGGSGPQHSIASMKEHSALTRNETGFSGASSWMKNGAIVAWNVGRNAAPCDFVM